MRTALVIMLLTFAETTTHAQTRLLGEDEQILFEPQTAEIRSKLVEPTELGFARIADDYSLSQLGKDDSSRKLPDAPIPKEVNKKDLSCANGVGKPCAALGGHLYFSAPFHMDEPDKSWTQAMSHPLMWTTSGLLVGLTVRQLVETDRCINANKPACNLLTRKNRAAAYALNISLTTAVIWEAGKLKEKGKGTQALIWIGFNLMFQEISGHSANPKVLACKAGRTPQCQ